MKSSVDCFVEFHTDPSRGTEVMRLREKGMGRLVELSGASPSQSSHLSRFMSKAVANRALMPAVVHPTDKSDKIIVSGNVESSTDDLLRFVYDADLSYLLA
ncbi:hypothetical protein [Arthrobacter koreensis]|uniref:hypothetical protein n=1 Tax=Arthrobacter koreensis TaxID=199136 RepID=UPI003823C812